ncbi:hypothetical protein [Clostridium uliginosum]|uniref:Uncharacterized protein n=1 Tax=Clostridium uliginosum TaxID=119641 RepID=A0A1I1HK55_9CLOT|nr:hypothetical protein [Clostridium uliginosum]SFC21470.1 hypothetical protein SAMN05421842_101255 [Clostridium uliginosum]
MENFSSCNGTIDMDDTLDNAFDAGQLNGLKNLNCISSQQQSLIILLIILYAWSNQYTNNYLMSTNNQLICTMSCLLDKLVDSAIENCKDCKYCTKGANEAADPGHSHKHRHRHRCRRRRDNCDCDCQCDCDCDCDCDEC